MRGEGLEFCFACRIELWEDLGLEIPHWYQEKVIVHA